MTKFAVIDAVEDPPDVTVSVVPLSSVEDIDPPEADQMLNAFPSGCMDSEK